MSFSLGVSVRLYYPIWNSVSQSRPSVKSLRFACIPIGRVRCISQTRTRASNNHDKDVTQEELSEFDKLVAQDKEKQIRTPWHREGSEKPPVSRPRSAGAMTKGKLLTTPSRLLKLILPLTTRDQNSDRKDVEPLALLVHPQQPLSYLERLIQSELPSTRQDDGAVKIPAVNFNAADAMADEDMQQRDSSSSSQQQELENRPGVETYSGLGRESRRSDEEEQELSFVRWSKSAEIGDFIRDAARGKEFIIEIEGAPREIRVGVPSFNDRTFYLRSRLRKNASRISDMAKLKQECDILAHRSAQRFAYAGFAAVTGYGGVVYWLTFQTDLGWDVMEPVTYLVGLAGLLGGYGWFLLNRREASYQSAMNLTVSRRQSALYDRRGFDLRKWQMLVDEANSLRREIMAIAAEYDTDWNELHDARSEDVVRSMREQRNAQQVAGPTEEEQKETEKREANRRKKV